MNFIRPIGEYTCFIHWRDGLLGSKLKLTVKVNGGLASISNPITLSKPWATGLILKYMNCAVSCGWYNVFHLVRRATRLYPHCSRCRCKCRAQPCVSQTTPHIRAFTVHNPRYLIAAIMNDETSTCTFVRDKHCDKLHKYFVD